MQIATLTSLTDPENPTSQVALGSISDNGIVTASTLTINVWENGRRFDIGGGQAFAVNDYGAVVGDLLPPQVSTDEAFLWQNGTMVILPQLVAAWGINTSGQIAGAVAIAGSGSTVRDEAALYQNGQVTLLGLLDLNSPKANSWSTAINANGEVVGYASVASGGVHAFHWWNGVLTDLGALTPGDSSVAMAINAFSEAVGYDRSASGASSNAVVWQNNKIAALPELNGDNYSAAYGINAAGLIVGLSGTQGSIYTRATLWDNGQAIDLNSLLSATSGWTLTSASGISDNGEIVGTGIFDGINTSFALTLGSGTAQIGASAAMAVAAETNPLPQLYGPILVIDDAADVGTALDGLQKVAAAHYLGGVDFTDPGVPTIGVTTAQLTSDSGALAKFTGNFVLAAPNAAMAELSSPAADYTVAASGGGVTVTGNGATLHLASLAQLRFADVTELVAATPGSGTVTSGNLAELYGAALDRQPDIAGLAYYQDYLQANPATSLLQFAEWFLSSAEYAKAHSYAATTAGDAQFIQDSYQNLLHRAPTAAESGFYQTNVMTPAEANLTHGTSAFAVAQLQAHAQMLVYFSNSAEFLSDVQITAQTPASAQHWLILT